MKLLEPEDRLFFMWLCNPVNALATIKHLKTLHRCRTNSELPLGATTKYACNLEDPRTFQYCTCMRATTGTADKVKDNIVLPLAGTEYIVNDKIDWTCFFEDREDYTALHRFCWLNNTPQFFISSEPGYRFISNWIETFHHNEDDFAYQSYTISERLVHWMLFLTRWENQASLKKKDELLIFDSIKKQLYIVANSLEQHGRHYTNNHLLNNGRALYMVGWFINDPDMIDIGRRCIRFGCGLISSKGFLKEHSTHYHLLIAKNFLEIFLVAAEFDHDFIKELKPTLKNLFNIASLLIGQKSDSPIPLIGDISPDATPLWLSTMMFYLLNERVEGSTEDKSEICWFDSWDVSNTDISFLSPTNTTTNLNDQESGFFYCREGAFRLFFHNPVSTSKPNFSHYHVDDLSFSLMIGDKAVIQDPGRPTYIRSHILSLYARSPYAHNTVFFNQYPISPPQSKLFPERYTHPIVTVKEVEQKEGTKLIIMHDGFKRIHKNIYFQREFKVSESYFCLNDYWQVPVQGMVMTRFHLGNEITEIIREDNCLILVFQKANEKLKLNYKIEKLVEIKISRGITGTKPEKCAGWAFPKYGVSLPAYTLNFIQEISGSFVNNFEISRKKINHQ
ncbi:MAG: heparinase II/III-family protein [Victivallaceae bacterium]|nr:heparinase II/III-family protein [Victivallaceae bacterium]